MARDDPDFPAGAPPLEFGYAVDVTGDSPHAVHRNPLSLEIDNWMVSIETADSCGPHLSVSGCQQVYLELGLADDDHLGRDGTLRTNIPRAAYPGTTQDRTDIAAGLAQIYANYNVEVSTRVPTTGLYSTIFIGGSYWARNAVDLQKWDPAGRDMVGIASGDHPDYGNTDKSDGAWVFSEEIPGGVSTTSSRSPLRATPSPEPYSSLRSAWFQSRPAQSFG